MRHGRQSADHERPEQLRGTVMNTRFLIPLALAAFALVACASTSDGDTDDTDTMSDNASMSGAAAATGSTGATTGSAATTSGSTTSGGAASTGTSGSETPKPSTTQAMQIQLQELDGNDDRFIARDELEPNHKLAMEFATYDSDSDGRISEAEFVAYVEANTDD
jgi:hypothetical protein